MMLRILKRFDYARATHNLIAFEESVSCWLIENCENVTPTMFNLQLPKDMLNLTEVLTSNYGKGNLTDTEGLVSEITLGQIIEMQQRVHF